jgi:hypothetical protein
MQKKSKKAKENYQNSLGRCLKIERVKENFKSTQRKKGK